MPALKKVYVEITNVCNLRCEFCPPVLRPRGFLSRERFGIILGKLSGRTKILYFHIKGEPLLHPGLGSFLDMAREAGFAVHLTTNGILLSERLDALLARPALERVNISLHSLAGLPEQERKDAVGGIFASIDILAREPSIKVLSLRQWDSSIADKNLVRLGPKLNFHPAERFVWPELPGTVDFGGTGFCYALRDQAGILLDGSVVPCCLDAEGRITLGNIYESDWDEIVASPRARALYKGFSERRVVERLCRTCGFRTRFG